MICKHFIGNNIHQQHKLQKANPKDHSKFFSNSIQAEKINKIAHKLEQTPTKNNRKHKRNN